MTRELGARILGMRLATAPAHEVATERISA
jgi:hypothetical protein